MHPFFCGGGEKERLDEVFLKGKRKKRASTHKEKGPFPLETRGRSRG